VCAPGLKYGEARQLRGERLELLNENKERLKLQEEENEEVRDRIRLSRGVGRRSAGSWEGDTWWRVSDHVCGVFKPTKNASYS
jgi:hypothetical protein